MSINYYPVSTVLPIYGVFCGVGIFLTSLRIWVRIHFARETFRKPLGLDDLFIVLGLIVVCACTGIQFYNGLKGTAGGETTDMQEQQVIVGHKVGYSMLIFEKLAFGFIKLSLLFFFRRIFGFWPSFRRWNNILIGLVTAWMTAFAFADLLLCGTHIDIHWAIDQTSGKKYCGSTGALLIAFAITSVLTDIMVLSLPLPYIGRLQMARARKWAASFIFLLGGISTLAGVFRSIFLCVSVSLGWFGWGSETPPGYVEPLVLQMFNPTFWVMMEMYLGSWAANLPALAPLMRSLNTKYRLYSSTVYRKLSFTHGSGSVGTVRKGSGSEGWLTAARAPDSSNTAQLGDKMRISTPSKGGEIGSVLQVKIEPGNMSDVEDFRV